MHLQSRLVLRVVVKLVGHVRVVVADSLAQRHGYLLAGDFLGCGAAGSRKENEREEQINPKQVHLSGASRPSLSALAQTAINPLRRLLSPPARLDAARRSHLASLGILHGVASNVQALFTLG